MAPDRRPRRARRQDMVADYYAMLGADPGADRASLEAALARCQPLWSSGTRNPKTKHTYQSYLDQIPEIRKALLGDPAARAAYDAELAAARRAERDRVLDELQRLVRLRSAKGGLTVSDRALLREHSDRLGVDPADLARLIEPIPPRPEAPVEVEAVEPPPDVLDPVTRKQIRVALDHLRRARPVRRPRPGSRRPPGRGHRQGRRRAAPLDAEDPGHRREDRLARGRLARPVTPGLAPVEGPLRPDPRARGRGAAGRVDRLRGQGAAQARLRDPRRARRRGGPAGDHRRAGGDPHHPRLPGPRRGPRRHAGLDPQPLDRPPRATSVAAPARA